MENVSKIDITDVYSEVVNKLRAKLNVLDPRNRVVEKTLEITISDSTNFVLLSPTKTSYVRNIYKNEVLLKYGIDYYFIYYLPEEDRGKVIFTESLETGDEIKIVWGEVVKSNFVFDDFPRNDLNEDSYPRVGCNITFRTKPGGMGSPAQQIFESDFLVQIKFIGKDKLIIRKLLQEMRDFLMKQSTNFYNFKYINPESFNEYNNFDDNTNTTFIQFLEFTAPSRYEIITQEEAI